jgi:hypothetical protein
VEVLTFVNVQRATAATSVSALPTILVSASDGRPSSGSILFYDYKIVRDQWRNDGYAWPKKTDSNVRTFTFAAFIEWF